MQQSYAAFGRQQEEGRRVQAVGYRDQRGLSKKKKKRPPQKPKQLRSQDKPCCMQTGTGKAMLAQQKQADRTIDALPADRGNAICT